MDSTYWIKYSDYDIVKDERGMDCIKPAANAVPMCYDVAVKLGRNVAELMNIVLDDHDVMGRNMKSPAASGCWASRWRRTTTSRCPTCART